MLGMDAGEGYLCPYQSAIQASIIVIWAFSYRAALSAHTAQALAQAGIRRFYR
jgi:hypothetical protein